MAVRVLVPFNLAQAGGRRLEQRRPQRHLGGALPQRRERKGACAWTKVYVSLTLTTLTDDADSEEMENSSDSLPPSNIGYTTRAHVVNQPSDLEPILEDMVERVFQAENPSLIRGVEPESPRFLSTLPATTPSLAPCNSPSQWGFKG